MKSKKSMILKAPRSAPRGCAREIQRNKPVEAFHRACDPDGRFPVGVSRNNGKRGFLPGKAAPRGSWRFIATGNLP
jgi:hypothetical protein